MGHTCIVLVLQTTGMLIMVLRSHGQPSQGLSSMDVNNPQQIGTRINSDYTISVPMPTHTLYQVLWRYKDHIIAGYIQGGLPGYLSNNYDRDMELDTANYALTVRNITADEEGRYRCDFSFSDGNSEESWFYHLTVYEPPSRVEIRSMSQTVSEGDDHTIRCTAYGVYPGNSIIFRVISGSTSHADNSDVTEPSYSTEGGGRNFTVSTDLTVALDRTFSTPGIFCRAVFTAFGNTVRNDSRVQNLTVEYCDSLSIQGGHSSNPIRANTPVTFTCTADCSPLRDLTLYRRARGSRPLTVIQQVTGSRTLSNTYTIQKEDNGLGFYCDISDQDQSTNDVYYNVEFSATSMDLNTNGNTNEGSQYTITCTTNEANPSASINWSWNRNGDVPGQVVDSELDGQCCGSAKRTRSVRTISLTKTYNDARITCTSGSASKDTTLDIQFEPTTNEIECSHSCTRKRDETMELKCITDSYNPASVLTSFLWKVGNSANNDGQGRFEDISFTTTDSNEVFGGVIATSTYSFTVGSAHDGSYVTCIPKRDTAEIVSLRKSAVITVNYPPEVSVSGCNPDVVDGESCSLTCETSGGNPNTPSSFTYSWTWQPKFQTQFGPEISNHDDLALDSVSYDQSGDYRCSVTSLGLTESDQRTVNVTYAPIGINLEDGNIKTFFADMEGEVTLEIMIHSFPADNVNFVWSKESSSINTNIENPMENNRTKSSLQLMNVNVDDYGNYTVTASNGVGTPTVIIIRLLKEGKPTPPYDLRAFSISYREIKLSYRPGLDGNAVQTLQLKYKGNSSTDFQEFGEPVIDPLAREQINVTVSGDIEPLETYQFTVVADNNNDGPATVSSTLHVTTKGKPLIDRGDITKTENGEEITLVWTMITVEVTRVILRQCTKDNECIFHDINVSDTMKTAHIDNGTDFTLLIYQDDDLVSELHFSDEKKPPPRNEDDNTALIVIIVCVIVAAMIVATVIIFVVIKMKRRSKDESPVVKDDFNDIGNDNANGEPQENEVSMLYTQPDKTKKKKKAAAAPQRIEEELKEMNAQPQNREKNVGEQGAVGPAEYAVVDKSKKTKNKKPKPTENGNSENEMSEMYAKPMKDKKKKKIDTDTMATEEEMKAMYAQPNKVSRGKKPTPGEKPSVKPKPSTSNAQPAASLYSNTAMSAMPNDNPYANTAEINSEQGAYANVEFSPRPAASTANQDKQGGLIYADISFAHEAAKAQPAPDPDYIHGADERVEYAVVDFTAKAPKPPESESDDEEDVDKK